MSKHSFNKALIKPVLLLLFAVLLLSSVTLASTLTKADSNSNAPSDKPPTKAVEIKRDDFGNFNQYVSLVLKGSWGDEPGEFGLYTPSGDGEKVGPQNFTLDKEGNLFILDQLNLRVQRFTSSGEYLNEFSIKSKSVEDIGITESGNIILLDAQVNGKFYMYDSNGEFMSEHLIDENLRASSMQLYGDDAFIRKADDFGTNLYPILGKGNPTSSREQRNRAFAGNRSRDGVTLYDLSYQPGSKTLSINIKNLSSETTTTIDVVSKRDIGGPLALDTDANGNMYLIVDSYNAGQSEYTLVAFTKSGEYLGEIEIPVEEYCYPYRRFRVTGNGDVYQLKYEENGLRVLKWNLGVL